MHLYYWKIRKRKDEFVIYPYRKHRGYPIAVVCDLEDAKVMCEKHNNMLFKLNSDCFSDIEISDRVYIRDEGWGEVVKIIESINLYPVGEIPSRMLKIRLDGYYDTNLYPFARVHGFEKVCHL